MDDGFLIEPHHLDFDNLMLSLSNLDRSIKYTFEKANIECFKPNKDLKIKI